MNHEDDDLDDLSREFCFILAMMPVTGKQCQCPECTPKSVARIAKAC